MKMKSAPPETECCRVERAQVVLPGNALAMPSSRRHEAKAEAQNVAVRRDPEGGSE